MLFSFAFDLDREEQLRHLRRTALAGLRLRRRAHRQSQLRARTAERLPRRPDRLARPRLGHLSRQSDRLLSLLLLIVELISLPIFGLFYNIHWCRLAFPAAACDSVGDLGHYRCRVGFSAVTVNVRLRELMLPVLLYPLLIPLLIGAMETDLRAC